MKFRFKYRTMKRPEPLGELSEPAIPVALIGPNGRPFYTTALIDSGADVSAMHKNVAAILGLDLSGEKEDVGVVGGKVKAVAIRVQLLVWGKHEKMQFPIEMRVILSESEDDFPVILGRKDFFERFEVRINEKEKRVTLSEP